MNLFDYAATLPGPTPQRAFDGATYDVNLDHDRLKGQLWRVFQLMSDGKYRTLGEIAEEAHGTEASVSARLRDLRKSKYGSREIQRERVAGGLFRYRLVVGNTSLIG